MDKLKSAILPALVALVVTVAGVAWFAPEKTIIERITEKGGFGALSGPDIPSQYLRWGGVLLYNSKGNMQSASTTLCYIANPHGATSTVNRFVAQITTGTSTAAAITLATSTSQYATSTSNEIIADYPIPSGAQGNVVWNPASTNVNLIGPNEYLILKTAGAGLGGYTYGGTCEASFQAI